MDILSKKILFFSLFLGLCVGFLFQGSRGLYETTEGRYAEAALEMVKSGNYLEPTLDYKPHWSKPPMTYWCIAAAIHILGPNTWAARICNSFAFVITVLTIFFIGKTLWNDRHGAIASLFYATAPFPVISAWGLSTDTILCLCVALYMLAYVKIIFSNNSNSNLPWIFLLWIFAGIAFLTKGPPALLPLLALLIYHFKFSKNKFKFFGITNIAGILIGFAVGLSWYVICAIKHPYLMNYWLTKEVYARVASNTFHRNPEWYKPFIIYLPILLFGAGPWIFFEWDLLREYKSRYKELWHKLVASPKITFLLLWIFIPLSLFFIAKSRLALYILPIFPPVILLIAKRAVKFCENIQNHNYKCFNKIIIVAIVTSVLLCAGKFISAIIRPRRDMSVPYELISEAKIKSDNIWVGIKHTPCYGLQYYINTRLKRFAFTKETQDCDLYIDDFIKALENHKIGKAPVILIPKRRRVKYMERLLSERNIPYKTKIKDDWGIIVL